MNIKSTNNSNVKQNKSKATNTVIDKAKKYFSDNEYPRYMLKLTILFLACLLLLSIISILLRPSFENYESKLDKSYVKEIFDLDGINISKLELKDSTARYEKKIKECGQNDKTRVYSVFIGSKKIGWAVKVFTDKSRVHSDYAKHTNKIYKKMETMIGIFIDRSLAGIRVVKHEESARLTYLMEDEDYIKQISSDSIKSKTRKKIITRESLPKNTKEFKQKLGVESMKGADQTSMSLIKAIDIAYEIAIIE